VHVPALAGQQSDPVMPQRGTMSMSATTHVRQASEAEIVALGSAAAVGEHGVRGQSVQPDTLREAFGTGAVPMPMSPHPMQAHGPIDMAPGNTQLRAGRSDMHRSYAGPMPPAPAAAYVAVLAHSTCVLSGSARHAGLVSDGGIAGPPVARGLSEMPELAAGPLQDTVSWPVTNKGSVMTQSHAQPSRQTAPSVLGAAVSGSHHAAVASQQRWAHDGPHALPDMMRSGQPLPLPPGVLQQPQPRGDNNAGHVGSLGTNAVPMATPVAFMPQGSDVHRWPAGGPRVPLGNLPPSNLPPPLPGLVAVESAGSRGVHRAHANMQYVGGWPISHSSLQLLPAHTAPPPPAPPHSKHASIGSHQGCGHDQHVAAEVCSR
jgi:hypothetical protein